MKFAILVALLTDFGAVSATRMARPSKDGAQRPQSLLLPAIWDGEFGWKPSGIYCVAANYGV